MQTTVYLIFAGYGLTIRGYHTPGETDTNTPEEFEVHSVFVGEYHDDIAELLGEDRCKEIAAAIVKREGIRE